MFMNHIPSSDSHPHQWRRWIARASVAGAGGTTLAIWFEEVAAFVTEYIGVIILPVMAGVIYLFNIFLFKSTKPRAEDIKK
jgi:hypothetical protein